MRRYSPREPPPYRHRPGRTPHPERDPKGYRYGRPEPPATTLRTDAWRENEAYLHGIDLFNEGYFWEAHAAWEAAWAETPREAPESRFLQALVQLAAAFLKRELDSPAGAAKLLDRALAKLESLADEAGAGLYLGVRLDRLGREARSALEVGGPPPRIELET